MSLSHSLTSNLSEFKEQQGSKSSTSSAKQSTFSDSNIPSDSHSGIQASKNSESLSISNDKKNSLRRSPREPKNKNQGLNQANRDLSSNALENQRQKTPKKNKQMDKRSQQKIEQTNQGKRKNPDPEGNDFPEYSSPKKHIKGENGRIERPKSKSKLSEKSNEMRENSSQKLNASKPSKFSKVIPSKKSHSKLNEETKPSRGKRQSSTNKIQTRKQITSTKKELLSPTDIGYFSNKKNDKESEISSTCQSSPEHSSKNQFISSQERKFDEKTLETDCKLIAPKISNEKQNSPSNLNFFEGCSPFATDTNSQSIYRSIMSINPESSMSIENSVKVSNEMKMLIEEDRSHQLGQETTTQDDIQSAPVQKTKIGKGYQAEMSSFILNRNRSYIKQRTPKPMWNPGLISEIKLAEYFERIEEVIGQEIQNDENAIECLVKFQLNIDKLLENIKKNKIHYQSILGLEQRVLRNRKNI